MKCPHCNQEIDDGSQICSSCGKTLNEVPAGVSQVTAEPVSEADTQPSTAGVPEGGEQKGRKKWILPAAIAAVVAVAAGVFAFSTTRKDPKDVVLEAFKSVVAEGQTNPGEELFGMAAMTEKLNKESSEVNMELTVEGISDPTLEQLVTGEFGMTVQNDVENKKMFMVMGIGYADMNLANFEMLLDEKEVVMAIPELSSKSFVLNYADDLEGQINNSPYLGQLFQENGMDITGLNSYFGKCNELAAEGQGFFDLGELWKRYKEGSQAIEDLKAAMTVEKAEKKSFTIDGAEASCDGYHATITRDALIQFITTTKDFFLTDETLKKDFIEYMDLMNELQGTMVMMANPEAQTGEEMQEQLWKEAETQLNAMIEQLKESMGDVTFDVYVRKDGKMASFDYETTAVIEEEDIKLYGTVTFGGGYSMMSNVKAVLNLESETGEIVTLSADKSGAYEKDKAWSGSLKGTATNGTESYSFVYTGDYNAESREYEVSLDFLSGDDSQLTLSSSGMFTDLVKGESFDLEMSSIKVETPLISGENEFIELSGKYIAGPLEQTVEAPGGERFDLLAATEDDYNDVATEIMGNAFSLMMKFY